MSSNYDSHYHGYPILLGLVALFVFGLTGCGPAKIPFAAKSAESPEPIHCFDAVGHMDGSQPYILGGTCCCSPSPELMEKYHHDGFLQDMEYEDLVGAYAERGIQLASASHLCCNNLCEHGPHIIKGGKCMVSPNPGTINFEEIRFGIRYMSAEAAEPFIKKE